MPMSKQDQQLRKESINAAEAVYRALNEVKKEAARLAGISMLRDVIDDPIHAKALLRDIDEARGQIKQIVTMFAGVTHDADGRMIDVKDKPEGNNDG